MLPGQIDLTCLKAVLGRVGKSVVVVMPALTKGQGCHPGVVAGAVTALVHGFTPAMGGGDDQPCDVIDEHQP